MSEQVGPWRSCDYHQYRSWLRRGDSAVAPGSPTTDPARHKTKKPGRRRPPPGECQLVFRHHDDVSQYARDYLQQVTHARCRLANPNATLLTPPPAEPCQPGTALSPANSHAGRPAVRHTANETSTSPHAVKPDKPTIDALQSTESTPELSSSAGSPPPSVVSAAHPASTPDLCRPTPIEGAPAPSRRLISRRAVAPPNAPPPASSEPQSLRCHAGGRRRPAVTTSTLRLYGSGGGGARAAVRCAPVRQPPLRAPPTATRTVALDVSPPPPLSPHPPPRTGWTRQPRGLTKIRFATPVPENLTIIVGRKLEISLSGAKKGQRARDAR